MSTTGRSSSYFSLPYIATERITVRKSASEDGYVHLDFAGDLTLWTNSAEFARELIKAGAEALAILDPPAEPALPEPEHERACPRCGSTTAPKATDSDNCWNLNQCADRAAKAGAR